MSQTSENVDASGLSTEPATELDLARDAWSRYFTLDGHGHPSYDTVFGRLAEAMIGVANEIYSDDEDIFEEARDEVTAHPERLNFVLTDPESVSFHEAQHAYARKHMRSLIQLGVALGNLYQNERERPYLADSYARRDALSAQLGLAMSAFTPRFGQDPTMESVREAHEPMAELTTLHQESHDAIIDAAEHMRRLDALANARYRTYDAIQCVQRAVFWLGEYLAG